MRLTGDRWQGNLVDGSPTKHRSWKWVDLKVPSNTSHSMILWFYDSMILRRKAEDMSLMCWWVFLPHAHSWAYIEMEAGFHPSCRYICVEEEGSAFINLTTSSFLEQRGMFIQLTWFLGKWLGDSTVGQSFSSSSAGVEISIQVWCGKDEDAWPARKELDLGKWSILTHMGLLSCLSSNFYLNSAYQTLIKITFFTWALD